MLIVLEFVYMLLTSVGVSPRLATALLGPFLVIYELVWPYLEPTYMSLLPWWHFVLRVFQSPPADIFPSFEECLPLLTDAPRGPGEGYQTEEQPSYWPWQFVSLLLHLLALWLTFKWLMLCCCPAIFDWTLKLFQCQSYLRNRTGCEFSILFQPAVWFAYWWISVLEEDKRRHALSKVISCVKRANPHSRNQRKEFRGIKVSGAHRAGTNPHALLADARYQANRAVDGFAKSLGYTVFSHSMSQSENKAKAVGSRCYYSVKDIVQDYKCDERGPSQVVKMTDVDWHLSHKELAGLAGFDCPIVMYTFMPSVVSRNTDDYFSCLEGDQFTYAVRGGSRYQHKLWDWDRDLLVLSNATRTTLFNVEQVRCDDEDRCLVALIPACEVSVQYVPFLEMLESIDPLKRVQTQVFKNDTTTVDVLTRGGTTSIRARGTTMCYQLTEADYHDLNTAARGRNCSVAVIERIAGKSNAYHLRHLLTVIEPRSDLNVAISAPGLPPRSFDTVVENADLSDSTVAGSVFCNPIVDGTFVPARSESNDITCVENRIEGVRATDKAVDEKYYRYREEFKDLLKYHVGADIIPWSEEDVILTAAGVKQRDYSRAFDSPLDGSSQCRSFQKSEGYPSVKDPRNISNMDKPAVVRLLRFVQPVSKALRDRTRWYAFGRSPVETAELVHEVVSRSRTISETDFSRFDGTISQFLRESEEEFLEVLVHEDYAVELEEAYGACYDRDFTTNFGIKYQQGSGRASGSAETSLGNSLVNAFSNYCALREQGFSHEEAWNALGLYGGDDGLTYHPFPGIAERVMKDLELKFKAGLRVPGETVSFLARIYPDAWSSPASHHDILRAASKLHYSSTSDKNRPRAQIAWQKAVSIFVTDGHTPVIGEWATKVLHLIPNGKLTAEWNSAALDLPVGVQMTSEEVMRRWDRPVYPPIEPEQREAAVALFLQDSPATYDDYLAWQEQLYAADSLDTLPPPIWVVPTHSDLDTAVIVDGQQLGPQPRPRKPKVCLHWLGGTCTRGAKCAYEHPKEKHCRDFLQGNCTRDDCKFLHIRAPEKCGKPKSTARGGSSKA